MGLIAIIWFACIFVVYKVSMRSKFRGVGLPLMVLLATSFEYLGGFAYIVPGYSHIRVDGSQYLLGYDFSDETVLRGMSIALLGVVSFTVATVASPRVWAARRSLPSVRPFNQNSFATIVTIGLVGIILTQVELPIPMLGAMQQVGQLSMICAIAFGLFMAMRGIKGRTLTWILLAIALPFYYLLMLGFMSYGFQAFIIFAVFFMAAIMQRPPSTLRFVPYLMIVTYLILTACVLWLSVRGELREVFWSDAGFSERVDAFVFAFSNVSLLNPFDFESLDYLTTRINHGLWVGKVAEYHELNPELRLQGMGILVALFAWVPRFLWPGKPEAGGSIMLETHTGYEFASGVTFGAGQVVDFYVNFGLVGVAIGFFVLGLLVSWVDRSATGALRNGNLIVAAKYFVLGICLTRSLSEIFFLVSSGVFALLVFSMVQWVFPKMVAVRRRSSEYTHRPRNPFDRFNSTTRT